MLPHVVSFCSFSHIRGQSLIPSSNTAISCSHNFNERQANSGLRPTQMAIIWWLTAFVFTMLKEKWVFLSFTHWMKYSVVPFPPFFCLLNLGLSQVTHVRKSYEEARRTDHKCRKIGDTLYPVTSLRLRVRVTFEMSIEIAKMLWFVSMIVSWSLYKCLIVRICQRQETVGCARLLFYNQSGPQFHQIISFHCLKCYAEATNSVFLYNFAMATLSGIPTNHLLA